MKNYYKITQIICIVSLIISDLSSYYVSLYLAYKSRLILEYKLDEFLPEFTFTFQYLIEMLWIPLIFGIFLYYEGLYKERFPYQEELRRLFKSVVFSFITIFFLIGFVKLQDTISRLLLAFLSVYMIIFLPVTRLITRFLLHKANLCVRPLILVGFNELYSKDIERLLSDFYLGYKLIGVFDDNLVGRRILLHSKTYRIKPLKVLNKIHSPVCIHTIGIISENFTDKSLISITVKMQRIAREIILIPPVRIYNVLNLDIIPLYFSGSLFLKFKDNLKSEVNIVIKTIFDYILSMIILIPAIILGLIIATLIKLESKGPVFIVHERVGKNGKKIRVYKFRSMYENADKKLEELLERDHNLKREWIEKRKLTNDPRITRVGRFLRKSSLDELPQIINVLKGEMSIVGPRPVTCEELKEYYGELAELYYQVKPGITGYWQVSGRSEVNYDTRVAMDAFYILNWSLWLDIFILIKTVWVVLRGKGAY